MARREKTDIGSKKNVIVRGGRKGGTKEGCLSDVFARQ